MAKITKVTKMNEEALDAATWVANMPKHKLDLFFQDKAEFGNAWSVYASSYDAYLALKRTIIDIENVNRTYKSSIRKYRDAIKDATKQMEKLKKKDKKNPLIVEMECPHDVATEMLMVFRTYAFFAEAFLYAFMDKVDDVFAARQEKVENSMKIFDLLADNDLDLSLVRFFPDPNMKKGIMANSADLLEPMIQKAVNNAENVESYLLTIFEYFYHMQDKFRVLDLVDIDIPADKATFLVGTKKQ